MAGRELLTPLDSDGRAAVLDDTAARFHRIDATLLSAARDTTV